MRIREAIIVEGVYDKIKLDSLVEATIVPTHGFSIFTDDARMAYIRALAKAVGIIVYTDSDAAGQRIRNYLRACVQEGSVKHAYIPDVPGKERRKRTASKEGFLGVEGIDGDIILHALSAACTEDATDRRRVTKQDFYADGLSGAPDSHTRRQQLAALLSLPHRLSAGALLEALNSLITYEEYRTLLSEIQ